MSAEENPGLSRAKRQGLRIAFAVAIGFTMSTAEGSPLPFLAPMLATQFLIGGLKPLGLRQAVGFVVLIAVCGLAMVWLTGIFGDKPAALLISLGLIYFFCFLLLVLGMGGQAAFLVLILAVMVPLLGVLQKDLGEGIVVILLKAAVAGVVLTWLAHAAFPDTGGKIPPTPVSPPSSQATMRALANAAILLVMVTVCLVSDRFSSAVVVPITVASLLNQLDLAASGRAAFGLVAVNLLGGIVASVAFALLELRPELPFLFLIVLTVGLLFGGRAAADPTSGRIYAGALIIFLVLLGLGVSPLPGSTVESFATRIGQVLFAIACTLCLTALSWPASVPRRSGDIDKNGADTR